MRGNSTYDWYKTLGKIKIMDMSGQPCPSTTMYAFLLEPWPVMGQIAYAAPTSSLITEPKCIYEHSQAPTQPQTTNCCKPSMVISFSMASDQPGEANAQL